MIIRLKKDIGGFTLHFIGKTPKGRDKALLCLAYDEWLDARCTMDIMEDSKDVERIFDETGESLKRNQYQRPGVDV